MNSRTATPTEIAAAFKGRISRPFTGFLYTLGLLIVTPIMAILPLIYFGIIALVIYATYYHAVYHFGPVMNNRVAGLSPRIWMLKMIIFATPIFVGIILTLFMVKPIFARRLNKHQPYALNPENEPRLYAFITQICRIVGAPVPSLIELDSRVNAGASLRGGFFSGDLSLHIGLSLMAGLTMREFASVIAHELGHFNQPIGMRLTYLLRKIEDWFERLIYERDSWDAALEEWTKDEEWWFVIMVAFAHLGVWTSRKILLILLLIGRASNCYLQRQKEFNADKVAVRLAGSEAFESSLARLDELNLLTDAAFHQIRVSWNLNKRIPDNVPQFILNKGKQEIGAVLKEAIKGNLGSVKTNLFSTHPSHADRVRQARLANEPGIFHLDAPASDLFENFTIPARIVTALYYEDIGLPTQMAKVFEVVPEVEQAAPPETIDHGKAAIDRFLFGVVTPLRPIFPKLKTHQLSTAAISTIQGMPSQINAVAEAVGAACAQFDSADQQMIEAASEGGDLAPAREQKERARRSLRDILQACEERLSLALTLANVPKEKLDQLNNLAPALKELDNLRVSAVQFALDSQNPACLALLQEAIANVEAPLREIPCPWPEGNRRTLYEYLCAHHSEPVPLADWGHGLAAFTMATYTRLLGELTLIAEKILENPAAPPKRSIRISAPPSAS